jgi:hypothetical protein
MLAINILWLLQCAYVATLHPLLSLRMVWTALVPLVIPVSSESALECELDRIF